LYGVLIHGRLFQQAATLSELTHTALSPATFELRSAGMDKFCPYDLLRPHRDGRVVGHAAKDDHIALLVASATQANTI